MKNDLDFYKNIDPDTLVTYGYLQRAKTGYICPFCGNGTGSDATGMDMNHHEGVYKYHCFKCDAKGTVVELAQAVFNIDRYEAIKKLKSDFGDKSYTPSQQKKSYKNPTHAAVAMKIADANKNLFAFVQSRGGKFRGLPFDQLHKYNCGFSTNKNYSSGLWEDGHARFIVPSSNDQFLARYVGNDNSCPERYIKAHATSEIGYKNVFGIKQALQHEKNLPVFIVEGEIDAMSVDYAGFPAIALQGSSITEAQINHKDFDAFAKDTKFIVMLDNDSTGNLKVKSVQNQLKKFGFKNVVAANLPLEAKDANQILMASDKEKLRLNLSQIITDCEQKFNTLANISENNFDKDKVNNAVETDDDGEGDTSLEIFGEKVPVNLIIPEGFSMTKSGIYSENENPKTGEVTLSLISRTPTLITKIFLPQNNESQKVEIAIFDRDENFWHRHILPRTDLFNQQKLLNLTDIGLSVTNSKRGRASRLTEFFDALLFQNKKRIPKITMFKQPGWNEDCTRFIYPPGDGENFMLQNSGFDYKSTFTTKGNSKQWLNTFRQVFNFAQGRYVLGAALAAPCVKILGTRNLQVNFGDKSSSSKSALAKFAMSIYGNPSPGYLMQTFNSTVNALDAKSPVFNDLPTFINEFQSANQKTKEQFPTSIYNFDEGMTRTKLTKNSDFVPALRFRGVRIMTAEQSLLHNAIGEGAINRLLEIPSFDKVDKNFGSNLHIFSENNFGHFGKKWTEYLIENKNSLKRLFEELRDKYLKVDDIKGDHATAIAAIHAALIEFTKMLKLDSVLDVYKKVADDFIRLAKELPKDNASANSERAMNLLQDFLDKRRKDFGQKIYNSNTGKYEFELPQGRECLGYLLPEGTERDLITGGGVAITNLVARQIFEDEMNFPSAEAIIRDLLASGKVVKRQMRINGSNPIRFLVFTKENFVEKEEVRSQESVVRGQKSEISNQRAENLNTDYCNLTSDNSDEEYLSSEDYDRNNEMDYDNADGTFDAEAYGKYLDDMFEDMEI